MPKLTVLVPCYNNEDILRDCLDSVKWADEILVVDSGSTDRTREIAAEYTTRTLVHPYENSAAQKNWAIPQATHEWVMVIDTDERATPELQREIQTLLATEPPLDAYAIWRLNHFFGIAIRRCGWERDDVIRIFRKDLRYHQRHVHADIAVDAARVGHLRGRLLHYTYNTFDQYFEKFSRYTTWSAKDLLAEGARPTAINLLGRPMWRFFRQFILRQGFRDGIPGLILCGLAAVSVFTKYAKLWGMLRNRERGGKDGAA